MDKAQELAALKAGTFTTGDPALAAALMATGVEPLERSPCTRTITEASPAGVVCYHTKTRSGTFTDPQGAGISAEALTAAWQDDSANLALDDLIETVQDTALRDRLKEALPLAIMAHHRAAFINYARLKKWPGKAAPWVLVKKGNKTYLLPRAAKKTARAWGLTDK